MSQALISMCVSVKEMLRTRQVCVCVCVGVCVCISRSLSLTHTRARARARAQAHVVENFSSSHFMLISGPRSILVHNR